MAKKKKKKIVMTVKHGQKLSFQTHCPVSQGNCCAAVLNVFLV